MANTVRVVRACKVSPAEVAPRNFSVGEEVLPGSPFYYPLLWSGDGVDSGRPDLTGETPIARIPSVLVISETDPKLAVPGMWIQPVGPASKGDYRMFITDGNP